MSLFDRVFYPAVDPPETKPASGWWFVFQAGEVVIRQNHPDGEVIPRSSAGAELPFEVGRVNFLGSLGEDAVYAGDLSAEQVLPEGFGRTPLRALHGLVDEHAFTLAGRAIQIVEWDRTHQFCGRCGNATEAVGGERAKRCPVCGLMAFPRLSPAVIVLVERGDEVLLARHTRSTDGMYALLAGFVEPGESMEEAVQREIREETGIEVAEIQYFGSQPWPFPNSLMIGFTAQYAGGEVVVDGVEIADAQWFRAGAMPKVPPKLSIARKLIDAYATKHGTTIDQP